MEVKPAPKEVVAVNPVQQVEKGSQQFFTDLLQSPFAKKNIVPRINSLMTISKERPVLSGGILYLLGVLTRDVPGPQQESIPLRRARAEAFKTIKKLRNSELSHSTLHKMLKDLPQSVELNARDLLEKISKHGSQAGQEIARAIARQETDRRQLTKELLGHKLIEVDTEYGKLGGQVSVLNPDSKGPPIVIIPGSSNDPVSFESAAVALAMQSKRKVILLGYPDGPNGLITEAFTQAVVTETEKSQASFRSDPKTGRASEYTPYVKYFDALLKKQIPEGEFELWGFSAGGAISAKLLGKSEYQQRVEKAVILNPAGSATFAIDSDKQFEKNAHKQMVRMLLDRTKYLSYTWINDPRNPEISDDKRRKLTAWEALYKGSHYRIPDWESIKTKGKIVVFSGGKDPFTRSFETFSDKSKPNNDNMEVLFDSKAHHNTVLTRPDETIDKILRFQKSLSQSS